MSIPHYKNSDHILVNQWITNAEIHNWSNKLFVLEAFGNKNHKYHLTFCKATLQYCLDQNGRGEFFYPKNEEEKKLYCLQVLICRIIEKYYLNIKFDENQMQKLYLIHLICLETSDLSEEVIKLIKSNNLKNIQTAYLLTYPNKGEIKIIKSKNLKNIELAYLLTYQNKEL